MKFSAKVRLGFLALVTAASAFAVVPAGASTGDAATIAGSGTISPGLTTTPTAQSITFSGNGAGTIGGVTGSYSCTVNGNDPAGTVQQGSGAVNGNCNTPCGSVSVSGSFSRTGATVTGSVTVNAGCLINHVIAIICNFVPTSGPTVTSYALICHLS
ncbi:MAG: hypothetical protein QOC82_2185 [Frankiaceae bacterium]|jgi:hypothetical protein|nr:hypothetical protein [Frankiaceae bacterium]